MLKPVGDLAEAQFVADTLAVLPEQGFRVPRPVRSVAGSWVVDGWSAFSWVAGAEAGDRYDEVISAGAAFHRALSTWERPSFLDGRDDPWSYGDRVAWSELPVEGDEPMLHRLAALRRPVSARSQLVHGDLGGNVLLAPGLAPAIIDWPPYWRPVVWATAVVAVDALSWSGADLTLVDRWAHLPEWDQMLLRAEMYRLATREGFLRRGVDLTEQNAAHRGTVDAICARLTAT